MDCAKTGALILKLRKEKALTQAQLAQLLSISDKTVSKWERGLGCPDVSLLGALASVFQISIEDLLCGELSCAEQAGGDMKKSKYYVCPECGGISLCTGGASVSCCGRRLEALEAKKAAPEERLTVEKVEDDWFISTDHPMTKEHYISFIAFAASDRIQLIRQYPEWNLQARLPCRRHGCLLWYCTNHGLYYQLI